MLVKMVDDFLDAHEKDIAAQPRSLGRRGARIDYSEAGKANAEEGREQVPTKKVKTSTPSGRDGRDARGLEEEEKKERPKNTQPTK